MPFDVAALAAQGASNLVSTGINLIAQYGLQKDAQAYNSRESQKSRDWSEMMYERALLDQSPAAQVARLREAGLSPALALGGNIQGESPAVPSGAEASSGIAHAPSMNPVDIASIQQSQAHAELLRQQAQTEEYLRDPKKAQIMQNIKNSQQLIKESVERVNLLNQQQKTELQRTLSEQIHNKYLEKHEQNAVEKERLENLISDQDVKRMQLECERLGIQIEMDRQTMAFLAQSYALQLLGIGYDNELKKALAEKGISDAKLAELNNEMADIELKLMKNSTGYAFAEWASDHPQAASNWKKTQMWMSLVGMLLGNVSDASMDALGNIAGWKSLGKMK